MPISAQPTLNQILQAARDQGVTQSSLAARARITPETISRMKASGRGEFDTFARLAEAVGLEIIVRPKSDYADRLASGLL